MFWTLNIRFWISAAILLPTAGLANERAVPSFEKDVQPILKQHCSACHEGDAPKAKLNIASRAGLLTGGKSGAALKPGSLKESLLWINVSTDKMPAEGKKLNETEKDVLRTWIQAGAPGEGVAAIKSETPVLSRAVPESQRGVEETAQLVDAAILAGLKKAKLKAAAPADDAEFLRRVCLDIVGVIPTAEQAAEFLDSKESDKRSQLIDSLLASPDYGNSAGSLWAGLITAEEPGLRPKLETWLAEQFNANRGWDEIVRDLIVADGMGPETGFVMSNVDNKKPVPEKLAGATTRLFLGLQLQCAECHDHPFTAWKQTDFWAIAAFYSRATMFSKPTAGLRDSDKPVFKISPPKGQPAIELTGALLPIGANAGQRAGTPVRAKFLLGEEPELQDEGPFRPALAEWLVAADNPYFAEATVNRLWAQFFGRGLVNPIDDLSPENPPSHPDVLRVLADEFRAAKFDRRHLIRCIVSTRAYQRTSLGSPADDRYARMPVKVMSAESLYDSLVRATGLKEIVLDAYLPSAGRGGAKNKPRPRDAFVRFFNTRELDAAGTDYTHGIPQALGLMNGPLNRTPPIVEKLVKEELPTNQAIERLFLTSLSRRPTAAESQTLADYVAKRSDPAEAYAGAMWILLNSPEFVLSR